MNLRLRGVRVHNLKNIDVDIPHGSLTVITGVSGSGKSSLAFDTLYAEGQRRYIETFSTQARRFLDRLDKPDVESVENMLPAVALRQNEAARRQRETIAEVTELDVYGRLLFARLGQVVCPDCRIQVRSMSIDDVVRSISALPEGTQAVIAFPYHSSVTTGSPAQRGQRPATSPSETFLTLPELRQAGFVRAAVITHSSEVGSVSLKLIDIAELPDAATGPRLPDSGISTAIVVDRITVGKTTLERLQEDVATAFREGLGVCWCLARTSAGADQFQWHRFSEHRSCQQCGREFVEPDVSLLNPRSPVGACSACHGEGQAIATSWERLVPDPGKSLAKDALALLSEPRWKHERRRLLAFAEAIGIAVDRPVKKLTESDQQSLLHGDRSQDFAGILGFLNRLRRRVHQPAIRDYLARWCDLSTCAACDGTRLNAAAQSVRLLKATQSAAAGLSFTDFLRLSITDASDWLAHWTSAVDQQQLFPVRHVLPVMRRRLATLLELRLGHLSLDRPLKTLSRGEAQRVALGSLLAAELVNTLYVLDEPSAGLHPADLQPLLQGLLSLRDAGNTVVVIEHQPEFLDIADRCLHIGPGAGTDGGQVVYQGPGGGANRHLALFGTPASDTSDESHEPASSAAPTTAATSVPSKGPSLELRGISLPNGRLQSVRFPLGGMTLVTGVSGSGKTTLVRSTMYPEFCRQKSLPCEVTPVGSVEALTGTETVGEVCLLDDTPLVGGHRSMPATWLGLFGAIRDLFAETSEAQKRGLSASYFSFNQDQGGRCPKCEGTGVIAIDMQFLADVVMPCPECRGSRFRREALEVVWRGMSIADVLAMTAGAAFVFFKGQSKLQRRLKSLRDVGLGYLTLGQPLNTLSGGEAQRLKLADLLSRTHRSRALILMDEPTIGLHPSDVSHLLVCLKDLLSIGHTLVVIDHAPQLLRAADHVIELGTASLA